MTTTVGIKLDDATHERIKKLGIRKERSPHWMMKRAIAAYLEQEERYEAERQADEKRWAKYEETGRSISHAQVEAWLRSIGSDDERKCPK